MPLFSPKRFQPAYLPVERERQWLDRFFTVLERTVKGALFGCRMCGNCILQETAFVCPMTCAKGLRNGFCGEASEGGCVVDATRPCTWLMIFQRAELMGRMEKLLEINAPVDGSLAGHSAWLPLFARWAKRKQPVLVDLISQPKKFWQAWEALCFEIRQPDWWQGDSAYHPAPYTEPVSGPISGPVSSLEAALRSPAFVITGEIEPAMDANTQPLIARMGMLRRHIAAANYSDNAFATSRMSSLACSRLSLQNGLEPVMQIQARDRSRNAILSDALGAVALGVRNILCLGGDYHNKGPRPRPYQPEQFDIDAVQMLWMLRRLRDEGRHLDGRQVDGRPQFFLGAAASPFTLSPAYNAIRTEKKVNAGAQFLQTQMVFDTGRFSDWLEALEKRSLLAKVSILAGVCPLRSAEEARLLASEPGIYIPPEMLGRLEQAAERDAKGRTGERSAQVEEGIQIAAEITGWLRRIPGIRGVHLMVGGQEESLPRVLKAVGLAG